jgi:WD40 repeat protein
MIKKITEFKGHSGGIYQLLPHVLPNTLLSCSADGFVAGWDLQTLSASRFSIKVGEPVYSINHCKTNNYLYIGTGYGNFHWIDLDKKEEVKLFQIHNKLPIFSVEPMPEKNLVATAGGDGVINIFSTESKKLVLSIPLEQGKIRVLKYLPKLGLLLAGHANGYIYGFETNFFNEQYKFLAHSDSVYSLQDIDEMLISGGKDAHLNLWDMKNEFSTIQKIPAHNFGIYDLKYNPTKEILLSASRDKTVKLWFNHDFKNPERINFEKYKAHRYSANTVCWINENTFASAGDDKLIYLWEIV